MSAQQQQQLFKTAAVVYADVLDSGQYSCRVDLDRLVGQPLPPAVLPFLFPEGPVLDTKAASANGERYFFMLTLGRGEKEYGFCCRVWSRDQQQQQQQPSPKGGNNAILLMTTVVVYVVISANCWPSFWYGVLDLQVKLRDATLMQRLLLARVPGPGQAIKVGLPASTLAASSSSSSLSSFAASSGGASEDVILRVPRTRFFYGDVNCAAIFEKLEVADVAKIVCGALLLERRCIFVSKSISALTSAVHILSVVALSFQL